MWKRKCVCLLSSHVMLIKVYWVSRLHRLGLLIAEVLFDSLSYSLDHLPCAKETTFVVNFLLGYDYIIFITLWFCLERNSHSPFPILKSCKIYNVLFDRIPLLIFILVNCIEKIMCDWVQCHWETLNCVEYASWLSWLSYEGDSGALSPCSYLP